MHRDAKNVRITITKGIIGHLVTQSRHNHYPVALENSDVERKRTRRLGVLADFGAHFLCTMMPQGQRLKSNAFIEDSF